MQYGEHHSTLIKWLSTITVICVHVMGPATVGQKGNYAIAQVLPTQAMNFCSA